MNTEPPEQFISCPSDTSIYISLTSVATKDLNLTLPQIALSCKELELIVKPDTLYPGKNIVTYFVKDNCGLEGKCFFEVDFQTDYRFKFIGEYEGIRKTFSYYPSTLIAEEQMYQTVTLGNNSNTIILNYKDELTIREDGMFPYPSWNGYRFSDLEFRNDSVFIFTQTGTIGSGINTTYRGKKI